MAPADRMRREELTVQVRAAHTVKTMHLVREPTGRYAGHGAVTPVLAAHQHRDREHHPAREQRDPASESAIGTLPGHADRATVRIAN